jgi:PPOX class probable F420-dependent enzyme
VKLGDIARVSRAMSSAPLGPGSGVLIDGRRSAAMRADNISVVKLTQRQVRVLNGLNYATVATVMPDCSPEATVVWIETDGKFIYFNTAFPRLKAKNLQRDNRVAITVFDPARPYHDAFAIRGRAELILEGANEHIEKLARKYTGRKFRGFRPDQQRVIVKVTPERIHVQ